MINITKFSTLLGTSDIFKRGGHLQKIWSNWIFHQHTENKNVLYFKEEIYIIIRLPVLPNHHFTYVSYLEKKIFHTYMTKYTCILYIFLYVLSSRWKCLPAQRKWTYLWTPEVTVCKWHWRLKRFRDKLLLHNPKYIWQNCNILYKSAVRFNVSWLKIREFSVT